MRIAGLGLVGRLTTSRPLLLLVVCAALTLASLYAMVALTRFSGDVTESLRSDSPNYRLFQELEREFHAFSTDETLLVEAGDLGDAASFQALSDFLLDLQFVEGLNAVVSIFSLPASDDTSNFYLDQPDVAALEPAERLDRLLAENAIAPSLLAADRSMTLVSLMLGAGEGSELTGLTPELRAEIDAVAAAYAPGIAVRFVGMPEAQRTVATALKADQLNLGIAGALISMCVAFVIFRSWRGALICSAPAVVSVAWYFGLLALFDIQVDFLTTIVPTMVMVLAFADAVHIHFAVVRARSTTPDIRQAVMEGLRLAGPACAMTSLTTAIAFVGIGIGAAATMSKLAIAGSAGVMLGLVAVLVLQPVLTVLLDVGRTPSEERVPAPLRWPALAGRALLHRAGLVFALSLGLFGFFIYAHFQVKVEFRIADYLVEGGPLRQAEDRIREKLPGTGQLFVMVDDADGEEGVAAVDRQRLNSVLEVVGSGPEAGTRGRYMLPDTLEGVADRESTPLMRRFVSRDGLHYLIPAPVPVTERSSLIAQRADEIERGLSDAGLEDATELAGLSLLAARETPRIVEQLRSGLLYAIVGVFAILTLFVGSVRLALTMAVPGLLPILGIEAWHLLRGQDLNMTAAVALTIAFGISVDNLIHLISRYDQARSAGSHHALADALHLVGPPITATTALLVAGLVVTQFSQLPTIASFGSLVIVALLLAFFVSILVMPSHVRVIAGDRNT